MVKYKEPPPQKKHNVLALGVPMTLPSLGCLSPLRFPRVLLGRRRGVGGRGQRGLRDQLERGSHFCSLPTGGTSGPGQVS